MLGTFITSHEHCTPLSQLEAVVFYGTITHECHQQSVCLCTVKGQHTDMFTLINEATHHHSCRPESALFCISLAIHSSYTYCTNTMKAFSLSTLGLFLLLSILGPASCKCCIALARHTGYCGDNTKMAACCGYGKCNAFCCHCQGGDRPAL